MRPDRDGGSPRGTERYGRDTVEHARVVNLSDALFAIAMTLLAFKIEAPVSPDGGVDLVETVPPLLAFLLSFAVVANFWWHHHRLFALLDAVEPGLVFLNLALLGAIALVPFPTELVGRHPGEAAPAVVYLALMLVISVLILLIVLRIERVGLWRSHVGPDERTGLRVGWAAMLGVPLLALPVALVAPIVALALLLLTGPADAVARRIARV
jgi:uncharacterized membrane protein